MGWLHKGQIKIIGFEAASLSTSVFFSNSETFLTSFMCPSFSMLIVLGEIAMVKPHLGQLTDCLPVTSMILFMPFPLRDFLIIVV